MPSNACVRRGWQTWLLLLIVLTIFWVLVLPEVDLDPAPPLNLEAFFLAVIATITILLSAREKRREFFQVSMQSMQLSPPVRARVIAEIGQLRC